MDDTLIRILAALGLETWLQQVEPIKETLTSSIARLGEAEDAYVDGGGVITIHPKFMLSINLWVLAAAQALRGLGEAGRRAVEGLREHPRLEVRAAVAQVLDQ